MRQRSNSPPQQQHLFLSTTKTLMSNLFVATHSSFAPVSISLFPLSYLSSGSPRETLLLRPWSYSVINLLTGLSGPTKNLSSPLLVQQQRRLLHRSIRLFPTIKMIKTKIILLSRQHLYHCSSPPSRIRSMAVESFSVALPAASGMKR